MVGSQANFKVGEALSKVTPYPPLLFVITMEYLSRLMHMHSIAKDFKFHPHCKPLHLTHLMFADDLIMFCKADPPTIRHIMSTLKAFYECVGLKANLSKSQMVVGGCNSHLQEQCL